MLEIFENLAETAEKTSPPIEFAYDFENRKILRGVVSGAEAIKVWAYFALQIPRYRYRQFSWNYGTEAEELVGKNYGVDFEVSELQRYITECLLVHPNIREVADFTTAFDGTTLTASFTIVTDFGTTTMEVRQNV